jgi:hypothetical protein
MLARLAEADVPGVFVPVVPAPVAGGISTSDDSGVDRRDVVELNEGRRSDVSDGDGGRGSGGRL